MVWRLNAPGSLQKLTPHADAFSCLAPNCRLRDSIRQTRPDASPELLTQLTDQRADFASTCCPANSPPLYCVAQVRHLPSPDIVHETIPALGLPNFSSFSPLAGDRRAGKYLQAGLLHAGLGVRQWKTRWGVQLEDAKCCCCLDQLAAPLLIRCCSHNKHILKNTLALGSTKTLLSLFFHCGMPSSKGGSSQTGGKGPSFGCGS